MRDDPAPLYLLIFGMAALLLSAAGLIYKEIVACDRAQKLCEFQISHGLQCNALELEKACR